MLSWRSWRWKRGWRLPRRSRRCQNRGLE